VKKPKSTITASEPVFSLIKNYGRNHRCKYSIISRRADKFKMFKKNTLKQTIVKSIIAGAARNHPKFNCDQLFGHS